MQLVEPSSILRAIPEKVSGHSLNFLEDLMREDENSTLRPNNPIRADSINVPLPANEIFLLLQHWILTVSLYTNKKHELLVSLLEDVGTPKYIKGSDLSRKPLWSIICCFNCCGKPSIRICDFSLLT